jgi:hypothetical protein
MTLEERLTAAGVKTLEELEAKIKADAAAEVRAVATAEEAKLRKQITDLETIKASQGGEIGELRKNKEALAEAQRKLEEFESKKTKDAATPPPVVKTEAEWKQENEKKLLAMSDEDLAKLNKTIVENDALKAISATEEGKAGLIDRILGSSKEAASQEIFRRPTHEKKLTVSEQIDLALNKKQSGTPANRRPLGIPASKPNPNPNQSGEPVSGASFAQRMAGIQTQ